MTDLQVQPLLSLQVHGELIALCWDWYGRP